MADFPISLYLDFEIILILNSLKDDNFVIFSLNFVVQKAIRYAFFQDFLRNSTSKCQTLNLSFIMY